ncbi:G2-specific serine/threonine protein kinase [Tritrichomonas musculus]|uniref:G2-specific serine/threonine protein kinase n=1 Tax=Tritrichomonas musculus TaxID=1915356 RepID=A0ABR2ICG3_9EUKA
MAVKGTPFYIAPEIWSDVSYSPACDVYSFAIIAYENITSEDPFKGMNCDLSRNHWCPI